MKLELKNIKHTSWASEETHEHCVGCECVLRWDESENYCRWCEERMKKEKSDV